MKPGEKYAGFRERLFGSVAWGRKAETIVYIEPDEQNEDVRKLVMLSRQDKAEEHTFEWQGGQLVEIANVGNQPVDRIILWLEKNRKVVRRSASKILWKG